MDRARLKEIERSVDEEEERAKSGYYNGNLYISGDIIEGEYREVFPVRFYRSPIFISVCIGVGTFTLCVLLATLILYLF